MCGRVFVKSIIANGSAMLANPMQFGSALPKVTACSPADWL
jgi:hypothetical protein